MAEWLRAAGEIGGEVVREVRRARRRLEGVSGVPPLQIVPYHGYGRAGRLRVHGRVVEDRAIRPAAPDDPWWQNLISSYRRLESNEVPHARVRASVGGRQAEARCDGEGFFRLAVDAPAAADRLWHGVELELLEPRREEPVRSTAEVLVPPSSARFGVISDINDTIVRTNVADVVSMARDVLLGNAHTRLPFDGVAAFYRALQRGEARGDPGEGNPIFYVSSSPWNLYDVLLEFLDIHRIPIGPIELRDWGLSLATLPIGHRRHKLAAIRAILQTYPGLPFILVGDSGQRDPEVYRDIVHAFPGRILAAYIRSVSSDRERPRAIRALALEVEAAGAALILADDTIAAARHAHGHGWIDDAGLLDVETGVEAARSSGEDSHATAAAPGTRRGAVSSMKGDGGAVLRTGGGPAGDASPEPSQKAEVESE